MVLSYVLQVLQINDHLVPVATSAFTSQPRGRYREFTVGHFNLRPRWSWVYREFSDPEAMTGVFFCRFKMVSLKKPFSLVVLANADFRWTITSILSLKFQMLIG